MRLTPEQRWRADFGGYTALPGMSHLFFRTIFGRNQPRLVEKLCTLFQPATELVTGVAGVEPDGLVQVGQGMAAVALGQFGQSTTMICAGLAGVQSQGRAEI